MNKLTMKLGLKFESNINYEEYFPLLKTLIKN